MNQPESPAAPASTTSSLRPTVPSSLPERLSTLHSLLLSSLDDLLHEESLSLPAAACLVHALADLELNTFAAQRAQRSAKRAFQDDIERRLEENLDAGGYGLHFDGTPMTRADFLATLKIAMKKIYNWDMPDNYGHEYDNEPPPTPEQQQQMFEACRASLGPDD